MRRTRRGEQEKREDSLSFATLPSGPSQIECARLSQVRVLIPDFTNIRF